MTEPRDYRTLVPRVARALGLRLTRTRFPAEARSRIYHALGHADTDHGRTLAADIDRAAATVRPAYQRAYHVAHLLIGYAWLVRADGTAAGVLRQVFKGYYDQARDDDAHLWAFLRDDVRDRAVSSSRTVRDLAAEVRGDDPPGPADRAAVQDELQFHDVRARASDRLMAAGDAADAALALGYFAELARTRGGADHRQACDDLIQTARQHGRRPPVALALREAYARHVTEPVFAGWLRDLAAEANAGAVDDLARAAVERPGERLVYGQLLEHLAAHFQNADAAAALARLVLTAPPGDDLQLAKLFAGAALQLSDQGYTNAAVREAFAAAVPAFRGRRGGVAAKADEVAAALATWGQQLTAAEMETHLTGGAQIPLGRVRRCGPQAFAVIARLAADRAPANRNQRIRAVQTAGYVRTRGLGKEAADLLWGLVRTDPDDGIRAEAVRGLARLGRRLSAAEHEELHDLGRAAAVGSELWRAFAEPEVDAYLYGDGTDVRSGDLPPGAA